MLQNRVDPQGNIIKTSARGHWMGNRGQLHNRGKTILRPFKLKAWITCLLQFKNWHREVMAPNLYTELFFLDEATAFSAGHRPCFECRRADYDRFKSFWLKGNPGYGFDMKTSIQKIDEIIHQERIDKHRNKVTYEDKLSVLPDGAFVLWNNEPHLLAGGRLFRWKTEGYDEGISLPAVEKITVLTPKSVVNTFRAGYMPQMGVNY
jgi:hypothetical protein